MWSGAFLVGLGLRWVGIGFGLPALFHPDEPAYVLQALAVARRLPRWLTFAPPPPFNSHPAAASGAALRRGSAARSPDQCES